MISVISFSSMVPDVTVLGCVPIPHLTRPYHTSWTPSAASPLEIQRPSCLWPAWTPEGCHFKVSKICKSTWFKKLQAYTSMTTFCIQFECKYWRFKGKSEETDIDRYLKVNAAISVLIEDTEDLFNKHLEWRIHKSVHYLCLILIVYVFVHLSIASR